MAEFVLVFVATFLLLSLLGVAFLFGKPVVYQPSPADVEAILNRLLEGELGEQEWSFFVDMTIQHNEQLESTRLKCQKAHERYGLLSRNGRARLKEPGLIIVRYELFTMEQRGSKSF